MAYKHSTPPHPDIATQHTFLSYWTCAQNQTTPAPSHPPPCTLTTLPRPRPHGGCGTTRSSTFGWGFLLISRGKTPGGGCGPPPLGSIQNKGGRLYTRFRNSQGTQIAPKNPCPRWTFRKSFRQLYSFVSGASPFYHHRSKPTPLPFVGSVFNSAFVWILFCFELSIIQLTPFFIVLYVCCMLCIAC